MSHDVLELSWIRRLARSGRARVLREDAQLSLRELARVLGVDAATLSRWESGECTPRPEAALRWADLLRRLLGAAEGGADG